MSYARAQEYILCIEPLMAEETEIQITASSFPHQKKGRAKEIQKNLERAKKRNLEREQTQATTADIYQDLLRKLGNG